MACNQRSLPSRLFRTLTSVVAAAVRVRSSYSTKDRYVHHASSARPDSHVRTQRANPFRENGSECACFERARRFLAHVQNPSSKRKFRDLLNAGRKYLTASAYGFANGLADARAVSGDFMQQHN